MFRRQLAGSLETSNVQRFVDMVSTSALLVVSCHGGSHVATHVFVLDGVFLAPKQL